MQEISFRLQSKSSLFDVSNNEFSKLKTDAIASASCHGLVFAGSLNSELLVVTLKDLETTREDQNVPIRKIPLPSTTSQIATNCDNSILAVIVKINTTPHVQLYSVQSFITPVRIEIFKKKIALLKSLFCRMYKKFMNFVCLLTIQMQFNSAGIRC